VVHLAAISCQDKCNFDVPPDRHLMSCEIQ
jgi:hypothetical protein